MMKSIFLFPLFLFFFLVVDLEAQVFTGQLLDSRSGAPVAYANIGVIGKNVGTVSDGVGRFELALDYQHDADTLAFSCIGYETKTYLIRDFKERFRPVDRVTIELSPVAYQLAEVMVYPKTTKAYTLGNFCDPNSAYGNAFYSKELGTEVGVLMELPKKTKKAYLQSLRFYVGEFTFDKFPVRLNVYTVESGRPYENILTKPVLLELNSVGEYLIDLQPHAISVEGDFFVSLEYYRIPDTTEGKLVFCAVHKRKKKAGTSYYRWTSQGDWLPEPVDKVGFSVRVKCER